jgi:hypothetical protein
MCFYADCHLCEVSIKLSATDKPVMLSVNYAECRYAECHYAECRGAFATAVKMLYGTGFMFCCSGLTNLIAINQV